MFCVLFTVFLLLSIKILWECLQVYCLNILTSCFSSRRLAFTVNVEKALLFRRTTKPAAVCNTSHKSVLLHLLKKAIINYLVISSHVSNIRAAYTYKVFFNRPFLSCLEPLFQSEAWSQPFMWESVRFEKEAQDNTEMAYFKSVDEIFSCRHSNSKSLSSAFMIWWSCLLFQKRGF